MVGSKVEKTKLQNASPSQRWEHVAPVVKHVGNGPEAPGSHATRTGVAAVHGPKHEVALVGIQLQQQHHSLTTQLVNLKDTAEKALGPTSQLPPSVVTKCCPF